MTTVDPRAASGFGPAAEAYERGRPSYPPEAVERLAGALGLDAGSEVLDLAAGTGKLTRLLLPRFARVVAVDPSDGMLDVLRAELPEAEVRTGTAASIPLPDGAVDAVFVAEAFHWFGTEAVCREIARVLRPGGGLGLLWNRDDWTPFAWRARFDALTKPLPRRGGHVPGRGLGRGTGRVRAVRRTRRARTSSTSTRRRAPASSTSSPRGAGSPTSRSPSAPRCSPASAASSPRMPPWS